MILAGRGFGKTKTSAEDCWYYAYHHPDERIAVVAPTSKDLRETMMEGASGILRAIPQELISGYNRSFCELKLTNGAQINGYSAEEPERLRGPNFHRAYVDELASWNNISSFDMLNFALRIGENPRCIITTTPKPTNIIRNLVSDAHKPNSKIVLTTGSTYENKANLGVGFLDYLKEKYEGTRLGRQELYAEILSDTPGALWSRTNIEETRVQESPIMSRIVVSVDPAISNHEGSDETGIIVAGRGRDGHIYILADRSGRYSPEEWAREVIAQYDHFKADRIIAESNQGGEMVERTLRVIRKNAPITLVHASRGKVTRAEPVAAFYEQRKGHHVGAFPVLEDQMCQFTSDFDRAKMGYSPDRVDALVWACTELMETRSSLFTI